MPTRLQLARKEINEFFDQHPQRVFLMADIKAVLRRHRDDWRLAQGMSTKAFFDFLISPGRLQVIEMDFPWRKETRYIWRSAPLAEVLMSIRPRCHFSHFTAMQMHGLTEQDLRTVYVNSEQTPKPPPAGGLTQSGIDRAFRGKQRVATNMAEVLGQRVYLLNGKHTGYCGVEVRRVQWGGRGEDEAEVEVSDVERTLIDITVRPSYAGGPDEVLKAYRRAGERASANRIGAYLLKLGYAYPYHQAIGFYMEQSEAFKPSAIERFRDRFEMDFDFYLAYGVAQTRYDQRWRLHVPEWMQ